jgi:putative transcriptional regulator
MSKQNTIVTKRLSDGTLVQVLADGSPKPIEDKTDWARLRAMTDEEVTAAAMSDPDARPMTPEQLRTARRVPRTKTLRRALSLTQEEFAARYHIPIGTLRDWEQGLRSEPVRTGRTCASRRGRLTIKIKKRGGGRDTPRTEPTNTSP